MKIDIKTPGSRIVLWGILLIAAAFIAWRVYLRTPAAPGTFTHGQEAQAVKSLPMESIHGTIRVYSKLAAEKLGINIPEKSRVVAATTVPHDFRPQTVVSFLDSNTGQVQTEVKRDPYPWIAAENSREIRFSYGFKSGERISRLSFSDDLVQVKGIHAGLTGSLDSDGSYFYGGSISYRF